jgi:uncharacterized protein
MTSWSFYGRQAEIAQIAAILQRGGFFFCQIFGRRRIGKTSVIQEAIRRLGKNASTFYLQIPDGDPHGVVHVFNEAMEDMGSTGPKAKNLYDMAALLADMWRAGTIAAIDEFQYFHRKSLAEFTSHLQARIDSSRTTDVKSGLFALGSIHTEMTAILEDKTSPLFNRVTDRVVIDHWDWSTLFEMFAAHNITDRHNQLFLWTLFEGVPKFYRDCFDQGALAPSENYREDTLRKLFFEGSSPLKDEADNWFLRELRGRYDSVLSVLAKLGPIGHNQMMTEYAENGGDSHKQLGGYLKLLIEKYRIVEKRLPIFAPDKARRARYIIADNFLAAWLGGLKRHVQAARIRPIAESVARASQGLMIREGFAFEKLVHQCLEEMSRKGRGDFQLTELVEGYWDKADGADIEIDVVAVSESDQRIRFGSCKRASTRHIGPALEKFRSHVAKFLNSTTGKRFALWSIDYALFSPAFTPEERHVHTAAGYLCYDMNDFEIALK